MKEDQEKKTHSHSNESTFLFTCTGKQCSHISVSKGVGNSYSKCKIYAYEHIHP